MKTVGIKALNSRLGEYVRMAAAGETILVTDREGVVAELGPPRETTSSLLAEGVRQGWLVPPTLRRDGPPPKPEPIMSLRDLLADLEGDRGER